VSSAYGEFEPKLLGQFESKIEGLLSGNSNMMGASVWRPKSSSSYQHFEVTNIEPYGHGFEATAQVYFPDKVERLYMRTDSSAEEIIELSLGFPLPGTSPDDSPERESVDPKRRNPKPGKGKKKK